MTSSDAPAQPDLVQLDLAEVAGRFGQMLHRAGLDVTPFKAGRFAEALALTRPATIEELYWAAQVTLVGDRDERAVFDRVFAQVFRGLVDLADHRGAAPAPPWSGPSSPASSARRSEAVAEDRPATRPGTPVPVAESDDPAPGDRGEREGIRLGRASADELLRRKDVSTCTPDELERLRVLMRELTVAPPRRRSRRHARDRHGDRIDLRATLRAARRTGGDPIRAEREARRTRPRRIVLIADVSGSMEGYARAYLLLLHGAVRSLGAEAFVFATRLTRLTRPLGIADPMLALARATRDTPDWSGGTRIGETLQAFNDRWGRRGLARGAVIVIVSDGWESGDPALLGREMARLSRLAHRIVWVNPRRQHADYQPLAGGMAAALPFVDRFVSGHSLESFDEVLAALAA